MMAALVTTAHTGSRRLSTGRSTVTSPRAIPPAAGTYLRATTTVIGWTPGGDRILFASERERGQTLRV
jgi:hypothetical protein